MAEVARASRPVRVLLTCWGSYGDLFPYLALARRLQTLGHRPVVATCAYYRDLVTGAGLEHHAVPPDVDPDDAALIARVMDPRKGSEVVVRELTVPAARAAFDALRPVAATCDVLVSHPMTFAAPLVARVLGMPWLSSVLAPVSFFSRHDFPLLPPTPSVFRIARLHPILADGLMKMARSITRPWTAPVRELRDGLGLPDAGEPLYEGQFSPVGTIALYSSVLGGPRRDWPPRAAATGFAFFDQAGELPDEVASFLDAGEPPIVFTLGSSAVGAPGRFYAESLDAARRLGRRAVLLAGMRPGVEPSGPDHLVVTYAPHAPLFGRAAAIVHHGGIGTLGQAMRAGVPMLVVPHAHDQPDNAFRARRLGIARVLDARRYTAPRVARQLDVVLGDAVMHARAGAIGRQVAAEDGAGAACARIVALADGACP